MLSLIFIRELFRNGTEAVVIMKDPETKWQYRCRGPFPELIRNVKYDVSIADIVNLGDRGEEYAVSSCMVAECREKEDIIGILQSKMFSGIGPALAKKIYDKFGTRTIDVIENSPYELSEISGITKDKAWDIYKCGKKHSQEMKMYSYLEKYGFTIRQAMQFARVSATEDLLDEVERFPYKLMEVRGVTFEMADAVAKDNGIIADSFDRIAAAAVTIIKKEMQKGHAAADYETLARTLINMLKCEKINQHTVGVYIKSLIDKGRLAYRKVKEAETTFFYLYLPGVEKTELRIAEKLLGQGKPVMTESQIKKYLALEMHKSDKIPDVSQEAAVINALSHSVSVITGGPGTGKTTVINIICRIWNNHFQGRKPIVLMSPTGRAARKMNEATSIPANTIHSTLRLRPSDDEDKRRQTEDVVICDSLVIIDECSMLDMFLARDVLDRLRDSTLVLIGDPDQLPSVGSGRIFADIVESNAIPCSKLVNIHRQNEGSGVCKNAARIKAGTAPLKAYKDFNIYIPKDDGNAYMDDEERMQMIEDKMINEFFCLSDIYGRDNTVILCPFNKNKAGQESVNARLQDKLNPFREGLKEFKTKNGQIIRITDPVMQLVNRDLVSNGEVGRAISIDKVDGRDILSVKYENGLLEYAYEESAEIGLAYAMTVHKSQGSEYDAVITCMTDRHGLMRRRDILYTAVTRAKREVALVGTESAIKYAIENDQSECRNTLLKHELAKALVNKKVVQTHQTSCAKEEAQISFIV